MLWLSSSARGIMSGGSGNIRSFASPCFHERFQFVQTKLEILEILGFNVYQSRVPSQSVSPGKQESAIARMIASGGVGTPVQRPGDICAQRRGFFTLAFVRIVRLDASHLAREEVERFAWKPGSEDRCLEKNCRLTGQPQSETFRNLARAMSLSRRQRGVPRRRGNCLR